MNSDQVFLIALGGNLPSEAGNPDQTLDMALDKLECFGAHDVSVSKYFNTPCFPVGTGPDYVNAAARLKFPGEARQLLEVLHQIENEFGRARVQRWGRRTLDLDLLAAGDQILPDRDRYLHWQTLPAKEQAKQAPDQLILPHPRLQDRAFVLVPLAQVAPNWHHPVLNKTVTEMLNDLPKDALNDITPL